MNDTKQIIADRYLGDGVYARFDGYHVWLDLRAENPDCKIALEPPVIEALNMFWRDINATLEARQKEQPK